MIAMRSVHFKEKLQSEVSLLAAALNIEVKKISTYCVIHL